MIDTFHLLFGILFACFAIYSYSRKQYLTVSIWAIGSVVNLLLAFTETVPIPIAQIMP